MLLEATAKGSFGARMPRHQQVSMLPSALRGGHLHADPGPHRGRAHPTPAQHPKPIATGALPNFSPPPYTSGLLLLQMISLAAQALGTL